MLIHRTLSVRAQAVFTEDITGNHARYSKPYIKTCYSELRAI